MTFTEVATRLKTEASSYLFSSRPVIWMQKQVETIQSSAAGSRVIEKAGRVKYPALGLLAVAGLGIAAFKTGVVKIATVRSFSSMISLGNIGIKMKLGAAFIGAASLGALGFGINKLFFSQKPLPEAKNMSGAEKNQMRGAEMIVITMANEFYNLTLAEIRERSGALMNDLSELEVQYNLAQPGYEKILEMFTRIKNDLFFYTELKETLYPAKTYVDENGNECTPPDGDCLFPLLARGLKHHKEQLSNWDDQFLNPAELRSRVNNWLRVNADDKARELVEKTVNDIIANRSASSEEIGNLNSSDPMVRYEAYLEIVENEGGLASLPQVYAFSQMFPELCISVWREQRQDWGNHSLFEADQTFNIRSSLQVCIRHIGGNQLAVSCRKAD